MPEALLAGRANKAIACELGISTRAVEVYRARMMSRLGVRKSPRQLVSQ